MGNEEAGHTPHANRNSSKTVILKHFLLYQETYLKPNIMLKSVDTVKWWSNLEKGCDYPTFELIWGYSSTDNPDFGAAITFEIIITCFWFRFFVQVAYVTPQFSCPQ